MLEARLEKHMSTAICEKSMEMHIIRRDVEMAESCGEMKVIFYRRVGGALVEVVAQLK